MEGAFLRIDGPHALEALIQGGHQDVRSVLQSFAFRSVSGSLVVPFPAVLGSVKEEQLPQAF